MRSCPPGEAFRRIGTYARIQYPTLTPADEDHAGRLGRFRAGANSITCVPARGTAADALALGPDAHHALAFTALRCPRAGIRPRRGCRWYARFRGHPGRRAPDALARRRL